jgi:hypothetical protein
MALVYARVYCKLKNGDEATLEMAKEQTNDETKDALSWYREEFEELGIKNDNAGVDVLRSLFMLLIGLGMRESSGRYCEGRDRSATNTTAQTAEAGLFQTSYNTRRANPNMAVLFEDYLTKPIGFVDVFKEGAQCNSKDVENYGTGKGRDFNNYQKLVLPLQLNLQLLD